MLGVFVGLRGLQECKVRRNSMTKRNVLNSNKELQQILSKYPDDMKVVIGVESKHLGIGLFYDIVCGGLDTGNEKVIYIASEGLGQELDMLKEGEYPE